MQTIDDNETLRGALHRKEWTEDLSSLREAS